MSSSVDGSRIVIDSRVAEGVVNASPKEDATDVGIPPRISTSRVRLRWHRRTSIMHLVSEPAGSGYSSSRITRGVSLARLNIRDVHVGPSRKEIVAHNEGRLSATSLHLLDTCVTVIQPRCLCCALSRWLSGSETFAGSSMHAKISKQSARISGGNRATGVRALSREFRELIPRLRAEISAVIL